MLEDIADFIQVKYNSNVVRMIRDVERPTFTYPTRPTGRMITLRRITTMQEKVDEVDVYIWKKASKKIHNKKVDFKEKEKKVFSLGQCVEVRTCQLTLVLLSGGTSVNCCKQILF